MFRRNVVGNASADVANEETSEGLKGAAAAR
jgi:hypothetical protein